MPSRRQFLGAGASAATGTWLAAADGGDVSKAVGQRPAAMPLSPGSAADTFEFETDQIAGTIRLDGAYHGVTRLVDKRSGRQVINSRYSALNLFKLQSVNHYMGQPRQMTRTTKTFPTAVEVTWAATEQHLGEIVARYEVRGPSAVEVTVGVRLDWAYPGYELFLSSYFDKVLRPHVYVKALRPGAAPDVIVPTVNEAFRGAVLVFPRDANAAQHCVDGRWKRKGRRGAIRADGSREAVCPPAVFYVRSRRQAGGRDDVAAGRLLRGELAIFCRKRRRPSDLLQCLRSFAVRAGRGGGGAANRPRAFGADSAG